MNPPNDINLESDLRKTTVRLVKKLRKKLTTGEKLSLTERSPIALLGQYGQLLPKSLPP